MQTRMKLEGFEYIPTPPPPLLDSDSDIASRLADAAELDPMSWEFRQEYGFGVSTLLAYLTVDSPPDPNAEILRQMDDSERQAYDQALLGKSETIETEDAVDSSGGSGSGGCTEEALAAHEKDNPAPNGDAHDLSEQFAEIQQRVSSTKEFAVARTEWISCVEAQGYEIAAPEFQARRDFIEARLAEIDQANTLDEYVVLDGVEENPEIEEEIVLEPDAERGGSPYPPDKLAEVQAFEVKVALQIASCDRDFCMIVAPMQDDFAQGSDLG